MCMFNLHRWVYSSWQEYGFSSEPTIRICLKCGKKQQKDRAPYSKWYTVAREEQGKKIIDGGE